MTDVPICSYCGQPEHWHTIQDHQFVPVGGQVLGKCALLNAGPQQAYPDPEPMSPRRKLLLWLFLICGAWLVFCGIVRFWNG